MDRKLEFSTDLDNELGLVLVRARGAMNYENATEVSLRAREEATMHGYGVFFDFRAVTLDSSLAEMVRFPHESPSTTNEALRKPKCAVLVRDDKDLDFWRHFEEATQKAGLRDKVFVEDERAALEWASGKSVSESG